MLKLRSVWMASWVRRVPGWAWRLLISATLGMIVCKTVIPWAQLQRGYHAVGGEYFLIFAAVFLPLVLFRTDLEIYLK